MASVKNILKLTLLAALMLIGTVCIRVHAEDDVLQSGVVYDDKINYTLYNDGTLIFEGGGELEGFNQINEYFHSIWYNEYKDVIRNIVIGEGITRIGPREFYGLSSLESVTLPDSLYSIGFEAFSDCSSLKSISIPENAADIGHNAFYRCSGLETVKLPSGLKKLENGVFAYCSSLESIELPYGLESLDNTFHDCTALRSIEIPDSVTAIGSSAFDSCESLEYVKLPAGIEYLPRMCFSGCTRLAGIELPDGLEYIGSMAFYDCSSLDQINVPESLVSIEESAFYGTKLLLDHSIDGVLYMGKFLVDAQESLDGELTVRDGTEIICQGALAETGVTYVKLPQSISSISSGAFRDCEKLESVEMPDEAASIGNYAFSGCISLKEITLPEGLSEIGRSLFENCSALENVQLPNGLRTIGSEAFYGCAALKTIDLPSSVVSIGDGAFKDSGIFENEENVQDGAIYAGCAVIGSTNERTVKLRQGTTIIAPSAFEGDRNLEAIELNDGLKKIEDNAFAYCEGLKEITIPGSVEEIGSLAFKSCSALGTVNILGIPTILKNTFEYANNIKDIYYGGTENEWEINCGTAELPGNTALHTEPAPVLSFGDGRITVGDGISGRIITLLYRDGVLIGTKTIELDPAGTVLELGDWEADRVKAYVYNSEKGRLYAADSLDAEL